MYCMKRTLNLYKQVGFTVHSVTGMVNGSAYQRQRIIARLWRTCHSRCPVFARTLCPILGEAGLDIKLGKNLWAPTEATPSPSPKSFEYTRVGLCQDLVVKTWGWEKSRTKIMFWRRGVILFNIIKSQPPDPSVWLPNPFLLYPQRFGSPTKKVW